MTCDARTTIGEFLEAAAAKQPCPGGGSVAALAGALAASMGEMVLNYSVGKKGLEAHRDSLQNTLDEFHRARQLLLGLMSEDQSAYLAMSAARKLPKDSPQWRQQFPAALLASVRTPEAIAAAAVAILDRCDRVVDIVNPFLLSDLAVCAELAMATVRCGIHNVRANLPDVTDPSDRQRIEAVVNQLLSRAITLIRHVIPRIWERYAASV